MKKVLWAVLALAFSLRVWGILHDLPEVYYPDEQHFVNRALAFGSGDLNPHWFHKPALYMYLLFFEYGVFYLLGRGLGWFASVDDFARYYFTDPTYFFIIGRITTALFGVATVYLAYLIGKRHGGERVGILAALFLAVAFGHVRGSHFTLADVPTTFFSVLAFLFIARVAEGGETRNYMLAGLFAGLGTATKYYSVTMLPSLYLAHLLFHGRQGRPWWKKIVDVKIMGGGMSWGLGFFVGSPYNFLDPFWFRTSILPMFTGTGGTTAEKSVFSSTGQFPLAILHIWQVVFTPEAIGPFIGILALLGIGYLLFRHRAGDLVLLSVPSIFIMIVAFINPFYAQSRHLNPIFPFLCLIAAHMLERIFKEEWLRKRDWAVGWVCAVAIIPSVYQVVQFDYRISQKETRTLAREWIEANIPASSKVLVDAHGPSLKWSRKNLAEFYEQAKRETRPGGFTSHLEEYYRYRMETTGGVTYDVTEISHAWWKKKEDDPEVAAAVSEVDLDFGNPLRKRGVMPLRHYAINGYQYVVTTSEDYALYLGEKRGEDFPSTRLFYQDLFQKAIMIKEFHPHPWRRSGPVVKIFKLDAS